MRHEFVDEAHLQSTLRLGKLFLVVYSHYLCPAIGFDAVHLCAIVDRHRYDVGQVVLALGIVVTEIREPRAQLVGGTDQHAGVDLTDGFFLGPGVLLLDDAVYATALPDDASVARRVIHVDGQDRHVGFRRLFDQALTRRRGQQRHIAKQHEYAIAIGRFGHRLLHGMAGSQLLGLQHPPQAVVLKRVAYGVAPVAVDDADVVGRQRGGAVEHMGQQRAASKRLQHFWQG